MSCYCGKVGDGKDSVVVDVGPLHVVSGKDGGGKDSMIVDVGVCSTPCVISSQV